MSDTFKDKTYSKLMAAVVPTVPIAAQCRGTVLHVRLAEGKYVSLSLRRPQDPDTAKALYSALAALPTEPSYSGTGRLYYQLAVGHAIRGKIEGMALVPFFAGEDGPLAGYVLVDTALVPVEDPDVAKTHPGLPPSPVDPAVAPVPDAEGDVDADDESEALEIEGEQE